MQRSEKRWWSLSEVYERWAGSERSVPSKRTLERWCAQGRLPASKRLGKDWHVDMLALKGMSDEAREVYEDLVFTVNDERL